MSEIYRFRGGITTVDIRQLDFGQVTGKVQHTELRRQRESPTPGVWAMAATK